MSNKTASHFSARKRLLVAAISACFVTAPAWSNPTAPQVVNGSASFNQAGKLLTVTNSNGAIINWNTFSIGANETTRFNQASASSSVLNRVLANDPSVLLGTLSSNGRVWLVNPAGIMVGQGARIDVAGFVASTLNVRNEDFLAGRLNFGATPNAGKIENHGQITTPSGGSVYLIAPAVENHGIINAPNGEVILAAGQTAQLIDTGTPGVKVDITGADGNVTNLGAIVAEAGRIGMAGVLVRNSGTLNASSLVREGGRIFLKASGDAYADGTGRIAATGTKGGSIEVLGNRVAVMDQARLDASGDTAGGTVLVGGDYQGKNADVQNAAIAYLGPDAGIKADATRNGDGGKVIVWADDTTRAYGNISARGGANGGNGGFVETSGKRYLDVAGIQVDARAVQGTSGTWLLDPNDISIISGGGTAQNANGNGNGNGSNTFEFNTIRETSSITDGTINATLDLGTDVKIITHSNGTGVNGIDGNGDILMAANAAISTSSPNRKLKLEAYRNIDLQGSIGTSSTGSLTVELSAGNVDLSTGASGTGTVMTRSGNTLMLNGAGGALVAVVQNGKSWDNAGTIVLQGQSQINLFDDDTSKYATFNNLGGAQFNSASSMNFAFSSLNDLGTVNNNGAMAINTNGQSFESIFNQGATGTLSIADANFLNLQNAMSLSGGVNLNASGALNINENHGTAATLNNLNFSGAGGTLSIGGASLFPGKIATLSNVSAPNVAMTVGSGSVPGVISIVNGNAVFKSVSIASGGTLDGISNGTLHAGTITNDGTINISTSTPFDAAYSQSGTGTLNIADAQSLNLQNAITLSGAVNLNATGALNIDDSAIHGTAASLNNLSFPGSGGFLNVDGGKTVNFSNVDAGNVALFVGSAATVNVANGYAVFNSFSSDGGRLGAIDNGTLGITSGNFSIPGAVSYFGDVGYFAAGNLSLNNSMTVPGALKLIAGWDGNIANPGTIGSVGNALIVGAQSGTTVTAGTLSIDAGSGVIFDSELGTAGLSSTGLVRIRTGSGGLSLPSGSFIAASGDVDIAMTAGQVVNGSLNIGGGTISGGNITLNNLQGDIAGAGTLRTPGTLTVDANGGISLTATNQVGTFVATNAGSGDIHFYNTGDFKLGTVTNSAANAGIDISSGSSGSITQTGNLTTSGGVISVIADTNLSMGTTKAQSGGGFIDYEARSGSVQLGLLDAGAGNVAVVAGTNITDGNGASANNIKAGVASLSASNADAGPGSIDVDTQVSILNVDNSLVRSTPGQHNNPVTVRNSGSSLVVSVSSASDTEQLSITNDNTIKLGHISGATNTTLSATGANSDILVAQGEGTSISAGNITLNAGRDINLGAGSLIPVAPGVGTLLSAGNIALNAGRDINLGVGTLTTAGHDVNLASRNVIATNASIVAGHDISAAVAGDLRLNGSSVTADNDIFINMLGATSTLYVNDAAGLPPSFFWAKAPSTIHLDFPARAAGGMVVNGVAVDPLTFVTAAGGSGLFFSALRSPATLGAGLEVAYAKTTPDANTTVAAEVAAAAISATTITATRATGPQPSGTSDVDLRPATGSGGTQGADQIGGTEGTFGGSTEAKKDEKEDKNKTDKDTGRKKQADKPAAKKLATCS